ncbi:MAG: hypothetical protein MK066_08215 [Crocinitomicaceae bacterium]|nr:hypothetical protein [Crocinitomicaceae bacterium]
MKPASTLIILLFALNTFGQDQITTSAILGTWKQIGYETDDIFYPCKKYEEVISYYPNGACEWYIKQQDTLFFKGKWNLNTSNINKPQLKVTNCFKIPEQTNWHIGNRSNIISKVGVNKLVFLGYEGKTQVKLIYTRLENIAEQFPEIQFDPSQYLLGNSDTLDDTHVETTDVYLQNNSKRNKVHLIRSEDLIDLKLNCDDSLNNNDYYHHDISGKITAITDSTIDIWLSHEYKAWGNTSGEHTFQNSLNTEDKRAIISTYKFSEISSIDYKKPLRRGIFSTGATITYLGTLSTLFVAPLASINYRTGEFNGDRYLKIATYSLTAVGVGIPIMIIGKSKSYEISTKSGTNYWSFKGNNSVKANKN